MFSCGFPVVFLWFSCGFPRFSQPIEDLLFPADWIPMDASISPKSRFTTSTPASTGWGGTVKSSFTLSTYIYIYIYIPVTLKGCDSISFKKKTGYPHERTSFTRQGRTFKKGRTLHQNDPTPCHVHLNTNSYHWISYHPILPTTLPVIHPLSMQRILVRCGCELWVKRSPGTSEPELGVSMMNKGN